MCLLESHYNRQTLNVQTKQKVAFHITHVVYSDMRLNIWLIFIILIAQSLLEVPPPPFLPHGTACSPHMSHILSCLTKWLKARSLSKGEGNENHSAVGTGCREFLGVD